MPPRPRLPFRRAAHRRWRSRQRFRAADARGACYRGSDAWFRDDGNSGARRSVSGVDGFSEPPVQARPDDRASRIEVLAVDEAGDQRRGSGHGRNRAEVIIQAFDLGRPIAGKGPFQSAAERPTVQCGGRGRGITDRHEVMGLMDADRPISETAGGVNQGAIEGDAEAAPKGSDPGDFFVGSEARTGAAVAEADDGEWTGDVGRALERRSLEVRFEPQHHSGRLPVVAKLPAADESVAFDKPARNDVAALSLPRSRPSEAERYATIL